MDNKDTLVKWFIILCTPIGWIWLIWKVFTISFNGILNIFSFDKKEKTNTTKYEKRIAQLEELIYLTKNPTPAMLNSSLYLRKTAKEKKEYIKKLQKEIDTLQAKCKAKNK